MKNRMKDKNYNITYPVPVFLQQDWFWNLWARFMCPLDAPLAGEPE